jgi:nicotinamide-nucleotide amidase
VGYLTASPENHIRLRSRDPKIMAEAIEVIEKALRPKFIGFDETDLATAVIQQFGTIGLSLATAESCTGGLMSADLTAVAGASSVFYGGIVSYSNAVKVKQLNVKSATLDAHGAVSEACAAEMARGTASALGADVGVSITGIAGPGGGTVEKPVGTVCFAWYGPGLDETDIVRFRGDRTQVRAKAVGHALDFLRRHYAR